MINNDWFDLQNKEYHVYRWVEINTKNWGHYYPDGVKHLDLDRILVHKKSYQNNFIHSGAYKTQPGERRLGISFDKVYGYVEK